ncbi:MAG: hypothetical protein V3S51_06595 [Dehalococcoidia bacterium]
MDEAGDAVVKLDADKSDGDSWSAIAGAWSRWWNVFLRQYGNRCLSRWRDKCGQWSDRQYVERLWTESFVPLQMAGCEIAKQVRLTQVNQAVVALSDSPEVSVTQSEEAAQWAARLDDTLSKLIASHTELQKQDVTRSLKDLAEHDSGFRLGRLKRSLFGRGQ